MRKPKKAALVMLKAGTAADMLKATNRSPAC